MRTPARVLPFFAIAIAAAADARAQSTAPVGSLENPRNLTSADMGPEIDPVKLAASPFAGLPLRSTFRSFMSNAFALYGVWIYAADEDQKLYDADVDFTYPDFYKPTWGEVFDHVARQMRCRWSWDAKNRQFRFAPSEEVPDFGVDLAAGWRREDRGLYVWHAPAAGTFGMDIYDYGHFAGAANDAAFAARVRTHFALREVAEWPAPPTENEMTIVRVNGIDALYLHADTPRPGGVWRQWSLVVDGHAFVIVSAMPKAQEPTLAPQVDRMVATFALRPATTRPATP